ncbi:MAG TPA: hypothetical protein DCS07_03030 [Bdellovibrionales bacterium]|nr:MAG: hypothetical protein A2Z97_14125 [Bdellovibrionales bacterium GWB1_52_6]OFZ06496.1 MAG: hypothetical protein A2X97_16895 [Bdellovibrionales bacterium GWA1_52_35]OFZ42511.1 MAG: hypothetical protein A2070_11930 [Bdellovibrionales bacterium GWC1_52_8]HAR41597.1 hypothetical protein [Bdellovibrionales bacterium]HCM39500.1 hypothetical protein [Bdellovibrionales bacterium]
MKTSKIGAVLVLLTLAFAQAPQAVGAETDFKAKVKTSMALLKDKLNKYGKPRLEGTDTVDGKNAPVIYFGQQKQNNFYEAVDEVKKEVGGTATVFVKSGAEYVRVTTNVLKDDGSRAVGTELAHNPAYDSINKGQAYYGKVDILGKPYETGYEPIKNAKGEVIGIYYVGYKQK